MGDKSATAASSKKARVVVTVVADDTGKPIPGATVEIWGKNKGKTNAQGVWDSGMIREGTADLKVNRQGYGPTGQAEAKEGESSQPCDCPTLVSFNKPTKVIVRMVQVLARLTVKVTDPTRNNVPVHGAIVEIDGKTEGSTGPNGIFIAAAFSLGIHHVAVHKPGYGTAPFGDDAAERMFTQTMVFDKAVDVLLELEFGSLWGRVTSSNITVNSIKSDGTVVQRHFVDWFNDDFRKKMPKMYPGDPQMSGFMAPIQKGTFNLAFDHISDLIAPSLSVEQFVALCMIIYNETGGSFAPKEEEPVGKNPLKYFFERSKIPSKTSYNTGDNRRAGEQLLAMGVFNRTDHAAEIAQWNGTIWPGEEVGSDLYNKARECDFNKFRGHGLVQITFYKTYQKMVDPALEAANYPKSDDMLIDEFEEILRTDPKVYLRMVRNYMGAKTALFAGVNAYDWRSFGLSVAGLNNKSYGNQFDWRCVMLFSELRKAGFQLA